MSFRAQQRRFILLCLAPAFFLFTAFVAWPGARALLLSFQKWNGFNPPVWHGLGNFRPLLSEGDVFLLALLHNALLLLCGGGITLCLALVFAAMLHRRVRGAALFRVAFFFPNVLAAVAVALLWVLLYSVTDFGVFNAFLRWTHELVGWPSEVPVAFLDSRRIIWSMVPMLVWAWTGFYMVLFLAAMQSIPESCYEAARLDGASATRQFFHITLPLIREAIGIGAVFMAISCLKFFDPVWVMENQRPSRYSHVLSTLLYQRAFTEYNIGYGAAIALLLFALVFAATLLSLRLSRAERMEY